MGKCKLVFNYFCIQWIYGKNRTLKYADRYSIMNEYNENVPEIGDAYLSPENSLSLCLPIPVSKNCMFASVNGRMIHSSATRIFYNSVQMMFFANKAVKKFVEQLPDDKSTIIRVTHIFYTNTHKKDVSGMFVSLYDGLEKITGINDNKFYPDFTDSVHITEEERVLVILRVAQSSFYKGGNHVKA